MSTEVMSMPSPDNSNASQSPIRSLSPIIIEKKKKENIKNINIEKKNIDQNIPVKMHQNQCQMHF